MSFITSVILIRNGINDFTLWVADFPEKEVEDIQSSSSEIRGSLSYIMEHVPVITDDSPDLLQMVVRDKDEYILYLKEDMDEFFEKHSADGWSSRGDADDILEETQEILDALVPKQNTLSAVIEEESHELL